MLRHMLFCYTGYPRGMSSTPLFFRNYSFRYAFLCTTDHVLQMTTLFLLAWSKSLTTSFYDCWHVWLIFVTHSVVEFSCSPKVQSLDWCTCALIYPYKKKSPRETRNITKSGNGPLREQSSNNCNLSISKQCMLLLCPNRTIHFECLFVSCVAPILKLFPSLKLVDLMLLWRRPYPPQNSRDPWC